jgi:hypothetical protein
MFPTSPIHENNVTSEAVTSVFYNIFNFKLNLRCTAASCHTYLHAHSEAGSKIPASNNYGTPQCTCFSTLQPFPVSLTHICSASYSQTSSSYVLPLAWNIKLQNSYKTDDRIIVLLILVFTTLNWISPIPRIKCSPNFLANAILVWYSRSEIFELRHAFEGLLAP